MFKMTHKKIHISPPEDYVDIEKSLNATVIETSSDSEDEVTYTKTTPSHPRDRLRRIIKEEEKQVIVVGDNNDEYNGIDFIRITPSHPRDRLPRKLRRDKEEVRFLKVNSTHPRYRKDHILRNQPVNIEVDAEVLKELPYFNAKIKVGELNKAKR